MELSPSIKSIAREIKDTIYRILITYPSLFKICIRYRILVSRDVETAGVSSKGDLVVNPDFWKRLDSVDRVVLLLHEALHSGLRHHERLSGVKASNPVIWNIATDCVINRLLRALFTGSSLLSKGISDELVHSLISNANPDLAKQYTLEDIRRMNEEEIYHLLLKAYQDKIDKLKQVVNATIERGNLTKDPSSVDEEIPPLVDTAPGEKEAGQKQEDIHEVVNAVREALRRAGTAPAHALETLERLTPRGKIDWINYLVSTATMLSQENYVTTWTVPNRRYPDLAPGHRTTEAPRVKAVFAIDVSGSISSKTLRKFIEETMYAKQMLGDQLDAEVWFWDVEVTSKMPLETIQDKVAITGRGGTVLDGVIKELEKKLSSDPVDLFVILTDGIVIINDPERANSVLKKIKVPLILYTDAEIPRLRAQQIKYTT